MLAGHVYCLPLHYNYKAVLLLRIWFIRGIYYSIDPDSLYGGKLGRASLNDTRAASPGVAGAGAVHSPLPPAGKSSATF